jgi:tetratricopeptide (TPR) repeat protein
MKDMDFMSKLKVQRTLFVVGLLALVVALFYFATNLRGSGNWAKYIREWEAKGERFDFASFIPKPVPDDQNFALAPVVAGSYERILDKQGHKINPPDTNVVDRLDMKIFDNQFRVENPTNGGNWAKGTRTDLRAVQLYFRALAAKTNDFPIAAQPHSPAADVLLALGKYAPAIEDLRAAGRQPLARFPLNYDAERPYDILLPHLADLKKCSQVLQLRAIAELQNGQSDQALADVKLSLRLVESIRNEPFLISHLVRIAMVNIVLQPVWEGLADHQWSDAQLAELEHELAGLDFLADYEFALRGERACSIAAVEHLRHTRNFRALSGGFDEGPPDQPVSDQPFEQIAGAAFHLIPSAVFYHNEMTIAQMHQQWLLPAVDIGRRTASPKMIRQAVAAVEEMARHKSPNNILACMLLPGIEGCASKFSYAQNAADLARVACALERHRLAQHEYPAALDALAPQFIEKIPRDVINGEPLHYRRTEDGNFLLYSVGWNETDDGGTVALNESSRKTVDNRKGDWVWHYPAQ